jgi:hypothetical protein
MRMPIFTKGVLAAAIAAYAMTTVVAPSLAATRHHTAPGYAYGRVVNHPGILHPTPRQLGWGNVPMLDDGQGRYVPADSAMD